MSLLNEEEISIIMERYQYSKVLKWSLDSYSDKLLGYLGDHLRLTVTIETNNGAEVLKFFVKCMPGLDEFKAKYLKELGFFRKEYIMLSQLFKQFEESTFKWRPELLFVRDDLFVFEDVAELGYVMPCHVSTMGHDEIKATVVTIAKFHAQSIIYEEKKTKELGKPYRIWEDYSEYLKEPEANEWRGAGRNAVIDFLKVYSSFRSKPDFAKRLETVVPMLYEGAVALMNPSVTYRNVIVHRDLWTNNIFLKKEGDGKLHALIVDFQTALYCSPMLDLSSLLFFNTTKNYRDMYTDEILSYYYEILSEDLKSKNIDVCTVLDKPSLIQSYEESVMFGITQAAIIVPIVAMSSERREQLFSDPDKSRQMNVVSRSEEFIAIAEENSDYRIRVTELFDDIVERYIYSPTT